MLIFILDPHTGLNLSLASQSEVLTEDLVELA
jgi:hypothetical protein